MISTVVTIVALRQSMAWSRASQLGEDETRHADRRIKAKSPDYLAGALVLSVGCYCFAMQVLVVASHTPPALSQSAFVLAVVTSAAKADAAKAIPRARAKA